MKSFFGEIEGTGFEILEEEFDGKVYPLIITERFAHIFSRERNTTMIFADAATSNYEGLFKQHCLEEHIDFLRINAEGASIAALNQIPFAKHEFGIIQFQHNACWWGEEIREESRKKLQEIGYVLLVHDVAVDGSQNYEDWWVHPDLVDKDILDRMTCIDDNVKKAEKYMLGSL